MTWDLWCTKSNVICFLRVLRFHLLILISVNVSYLSTIRGWYSRANGFSLTLSQELIKKQNSVFAARYFIFRFANACIYVALCRNRKPFAVPTTMTGYGVCLQLNPVILMNLPSSTKCSLPLLSGGRRLVSSERSS